MSRFTSLRLALSSTMLIASVAHSQTPSRDLAAQPPRAGATIAGTIVQDAPGAPAVRRAIVTLNGVGVLLGMTAITDDAGRFAFKGLPAGRFDIAATKGGLITTRYGARAPGRPGTPVAIADDEQKSIRLTMARGGVITGTVRDEHGRPLRAVTVAPMQYRYSRGVRTLEPATYAGGSSDDRGVFRIWGLLPGEYYLAVRPAALTYTGAVPRTTAEDVQRARRDLSVPVAPTSTAATRAELAGYAGVFYPGTPLPMEAGLIRLAAGDERSGVDFVLRLSKATRIAGRLRLPDGGKVPATSGTLVAYSSASILYRPQFVSVMADGSFTVQAVLPGRYVLSFLMPDPAVKSADAPPGLFAIADITADGQDAIDLDLTLARTSGVDGRVTFDGGRATPSLASLSVGLTPVFGPDVVSISAGRARPPDAAGAFTVEGVTPGRYLIRPAEPAGWALRSIVAGGRDVLDRPIIIGSGERLRDVQVSYTDRVSELTGTFQNESGGAAIDFTIVVFPESRELWDAGARRIRAVRPATDGRFSVANIPPGTYKIAALTDVQTNEWLDPSFLDRLVAGAITVTIAEGERKSQDIRIK